MPNVGDVFVYAGNYAYQSNGNSEKGESTDTIRIDSVDIFIDSLHPHTVLYYTNRSIYAQGYYFANRDTAQSTFPFAVGSSEGSMLMSGNFVIDYSHAQPSIDSFQSDTLDVMTSSQSLADSIGPELISSQTYSATYSPRLRWFTSESYQSYNSTNGDNSDWNINLVAVITPSSGVKHETASASSVLFVSDEGILHALIEIPMTNETKFSLLDPLGRPIRTWQMPVDAGERQITLNVADVPSGVYFLRISTPGVEEMRKVVIVH